MTELLRRKSVDFLVEQFWRKGYLNIEQKIWYISSGTNIRW